VFLILFGADTMSGAPSAARNLPMQEFAFIFRTGTVVDPAALSRRNAAAREWALARREEGILRSAGPLEDEGFTVSQPGVTPVAQEHTVASVLVIAASDLESAVEMARRHPGLAFGTEIEVRPVKTVAPPPR